MFPEQRFTENARAVLAAAQSEAERRAAALVGTEHLLIGILRVDGCAGRLVLDQFGVTLEHARSVVEDLTGEPPAELPATRLAQLRPAPEAVQVIEKAVLESHYAGGAHVGTHHLLVALAAGDETVGARALRRLGVTASALQAFVEELPGEAPGEDAAAEAVLGRPSGGPTGTLSGTFGSVLHDRVHRAGRGADTGDLLELFLATPESAAHRVLTSLGVTAEQVRDALERLRSAAGDAPLEP